jgi:hypothetical protein
VWRSSIVNDTKDPVIFYEWKSYLQEFIKSLKHITDCHHLFIDSKHPGVKKVYHMNNSLKFKTRLPQLRTLQNVSIIKGFDPARKWYLYDHIWQCCYSEEAKELTCPKPTAPKKEIQIKKKKMSTDQKGEGKRPFWIKNRQQYVFIMFNI